MGKNTALLFIWHIRAPGSAALRPRPCAVCTARALRPPGALYCGRDKFQITISDCAVAGWQSFKTPCLTARTRAYLFLKSLFDRPASDLSHLSSYNRTARGVYESFVCTTTFNARPGLRPCGLDPAPPARLAPFGRRARFAADGLRCKILYLTTRSRSGSLSKHLV